MSGGDGAKELMKDIEKPHELKKTTTQEKNPLPTAEDIKAEKEGK